MIEIKFDGYHWSGGLGGWFSSREKLPLGTVRFIKNRLFHVDMCYHESGNGWVSMWGPVENNTLESMREFKQKLVDT